jgi:Photosynthesis system II assembly factor YCF48
MRELPNYVRERLNASTATDSHPEPDLLAAFAERSVSDRERGVVLQHLAHCTDCRELVWLSLPETELATTLKPKPRRHFALLRWVALATALSGLAITALLVLPGRQQSPVYLAKSARVASPPARQSNAVDNYSLAPTPQTRAEATVPNRDKNRADSKDVVAFTASSAMARLKLPAADAKQKKDALANRRLDESERNTAVVVANEFEAKPMADAPAMQTASGAKVAAGAQVAGGIGGGYAAAMRWQVSPEGRLLRSRDSGATWEPAETDQAKRYTAVAFVGSHVWAAASGNALYHSGNSGQTWELLRPAVEGVAPAGDIVQLEFSDPEHGQLSSSSNEVWFTADGGRTWHKQ